MFFVVLKLFNFILKTGLYPNAWCNEVITPIFKSGNKTDPGNYRGICVTSCLSKVFCLLLSNRLMKHLKTNKPVHKSQIRLQANAQTSDHLFALKYLIDTHVKAEYRRKIFACFLDFKKAFDSVWHKGLFLKLLQSQIGGHVYNLIKEMYNKTNCSVKLNKDVITNAFNYDRGVRQGCVLSPLLFNLYINEFPQLLENNSVDPFILPNGYRLNSLLYTDDLTILSQSPNALQSGLNILSKFCSKWGLTVNLKKPKLWYFKRKINETIS